MVYKNRYDEVSHKSKVEVTNMKMDMLKQRGDLERDRDKLANLVEGMFTASLIHGFQLCLREDSRVGF